MPQVTLRVAAAFITFFVGLATVWFMGLLAPAEEGVAEWLVPTSNISVPAGPLVGREEEDAQKVYETVLRELYSDDKGQLLVIRSVTAGYTFCEADFRDFPETSTEALADYNVKRDFRKRIPPLGGLKAWITYLGWDEYVSLYHDRDRGVDEWDRFYSRFPGSSGYIEFSPIGYNHAGDEAFVYVGKQCGYLCGKGWLVLLRKGARGWEMKYSRAIWIS